MSEGSPIENREYSLDVLKIVATTLIVFHHYQQRVHFPLDKISFYGGEFDFGLIVELFFILSGFFMSQYIIRIQKGMVFREFFLKRYMRLFPVMALSVICNSFLFSLRLYVTRGSWIHERLSLWKIAFSALGIQDGWVFPNPGINNPIWYISVLLWCYVVFFFTCFYAERKKIPVLYLHVILIFLGFACQNFLWNTAFLTFHMGRGYVAFFWGVILSQIIRSHKPRKKGLLLCALNVIIIPVLILKGSILVAEYTQYLLVFFFYPALIALFLTEPVKKVFRHRWIGTLGQISFDVYIWQTCLFELMDILNYSLKLGIDYSRYRTMIAVYLCACAIGALSYYGIERLCVKRLGKIAQQA